AFRHILFQAISLLAGRLTGRRPHPLYRKAPPRATAWRAAREGRGAAYPPPPGRFGYGTSWRIASASSRVIEPLLFTSALANETEASEESSRPPTMRRAAWTSARVTAPDLSTSPGTGTVPPTLNAALDAVPS